jgi:hypothetical protein
MSCRPIRRAMARTLLLALLLAAPMALSATAPRAETMGAVETTLYFGLRTDDGTGISDQAWGRFLADVVTPLFPDGLTVLDAYGQSGDHGAEPGSVTSQLTRMLIVVHPDSEAAIAAVFAIKTAWHERFPTAGLFHTESDVRIVEP